MHGLMNKLKESYIENGFMKLPIFYEVWIQILVWSVTWILLNTVIEDSWELTDADPLADLLWGPCVCGESLSD